jgi:hypothetical protein
VAFQRGFKTYATREADRVRTELGLGPYDALDPRALAEDLAIPIYDLSSMRDETPGQSFTTTRTLSSARTAI